MLATIHSAVKPTRMLMNWPNTRLQLPSLALYMTIRLTSISAPRAYIRTGSRWATKRRLRRLIIFFLPALLHFLQWLGCLAEQIVVEHLARNRGCGLRAETAVLHEHRQRDFRLLRGGKGDEQRMVAQFLLDAAFGVTLALQREHLRGAGLAGGDVFRAGESARGGAFLVDADHGPLDHVDVILLERDGAQ